MRNVFDALFGRKSGFGKLTLLGYSARATVRRDARLRVEALEDRAVPSGSSLTSGPGLSHVGHDRPALPGVVHIPEVRLPDLTRIRLDPDPTDGRPLQVMLPNTSHGDLHILSAMDATTNAAALTAAHAQAAHAGAANMVQSFYAM